MIRKGDCRTVHAHTDPCNFTAIYHPSRRQLDKSMLLVERYSFCRFELLKSKYIGSETVSSEEYWRTHHQHLLEPH